MEALRSRSVAFALASISSRSRSVRYCGCAEGWAPAEGILARRWDLRGAAVDRGKDGSSHNPVGLFEEFIDFVQAEASPGRGRFVLLEQSIESRRGFTKLPAFPSGASNAARGTDVGIMWLARMLWLEDAFSSRECGWCIADTEQGFVPFQLSTTSVGNKREHAETDADTEAKTKRANPLWRAVLLRLNYAMYRHSKRSSNSGTFTFSNWRIKTIDQ
ncbi:hypothetical protein VTK73DRAFT_5589 [Phialemonium thermophilum]|uniref:Uncharacterized protein n=1 Tax=Phialemonium thermophilum TaxID=223376 RepID=A0ABR3V286_9PEZI